MASKTRSGRSASPGNGKPVPGVRSASQEGVFRKAGEYWTVGYSGEVFRLKDTRGIGYLAHLLRHPAVEFHVLALFGGIASQGEEAESSRSVQGLPRRTEDLEKAGIHITRLGDAGEMLDEQAKDAYRRRLSELREELEEAKELGNVERAEQTEEEIDALRKEVSRAAGLGGRNRRAASASERARQSITKAIKAVLEKIAQSDAALGDVLSRCIKTGNFCSYQPDPDLPIAWEFAATGIEPADQPTSSGDPAPARADNPQAPPAALAVSPLSLAERTAFVGRENERGAIRAVIDHALNGRGSLVMLGGDSGWARPAWRWRRRNTGCALAFDAPSGAATKAMNHFPISPSSRSLKAVWRRPRASMISAGRWAAMRPNWPSWLQAFGEFFRIFRNHRKCRRRSSAAIFSKAFQRRWPARLEHVRSCTYLRTFTGPMNRRWSF